MMKDYYIYYNNAFMRQSSARLPVLSAATQFGLNVFEGIRVYKERDFYIFRLREHLERLHNSLKMIGLKAKAIEESEFIEILRELVSMNDISGDFSIRLTYLVNDIDSWSSTKEPTFFIAPLEKERKKGLEVSKALVTSTQRISSLAMNAKIKCGANYINSRYAFLEAQAKGAHFPIMKSWDGYITESSGSCVFLVKDHNIFTPSLEGDILESITRDTILKILKQNNMRAFEKRVTEKELIDSDEIFLCGTAAEITPVRLVTDMSSSVGDLTRFISQEYLRAVTKKSYTNFNWTTQLK